jgi:hypothetical protein
MAGNYRGGDRGMPLVECSVTFLTPDQGGRDIAFPPGGLSGNQYRPHIVIGDPNLRRAIIDERGFATEEYVGVAFNDGPPHPVLGKPMRGVLTLMYFPHPMYDKLTAGATFTVREGSKIVGHGEIHHWIE